MIHLVGYEKVFKNTLELLSPHLDAKNSQAYVLSDWGKAYRRFLKSIQPTIPCFSEGLQLGVPDSSLPVYLEAFNEKALLSDLNYDVTKSNNQTKNRYTTLTYYLDVFNKKHPEIFSLFSFYIHTVFLADSKEASGGTTSSAIGVLWANPRDYWTEEDYIEFFIHELAHTIMFLDERRFRHYNKLSNALLPENYAFSAVLNKPRPVDKVLHSLVVATEVLSFRNLRNANANQRRLHPPTDILKSQALNSIESLRKLYNKDLFAPRAVELIDICEQRLKI